MPKLVIYGLFFTDFPDRQAALDNCPEDHCFYVGRTKRPEAREKEHGYTASRGNIRAVYQRIRELEAKGYGWELIELATVKPGEWYRDHERFWIGKMIREGHNLANMRDGDLTRGDRYAIDQVVNNPSFRSVADVRRARVAAQSSSPELICCDACDSTGLVYKQRSAFRARSYCATCGGANAKLAMAAERKKEATQIKAVKRELRHVRWEYEKGPDGRVRLGSNGKPKRVNVWRLGDEEFTADYYMTKDEIARLSTPMVQEQFREMRERAGINI